MIVDSSALVAILRDEPESAVFSTLLEHDRTARLSAATLLETSIEVGPARHGDLDDVVAAFGAQTVPFDAAQARVAREAYARYGKGSGSPARLNFGDCISYALASVTGEPLLFKGDGLTHTDAVPAR